jgi:hypothetical protein
MKIGIIGLPQSGKKTLFHVLTGNGVRGPGADATKPHPGVADIRDRRFDALVALYRPRSEAPAKINLELFPDLDKRVLADGKVFLDLSLVDALCYVVRGFEDSAVYHVDGSVDPVRDLDALGAEFLLHDLVFVEKRFERLERDARHTRQADMAKDRALLERIKEHLEAERPLRTMPFSPEELRAVATYPFVTRKELVVALNASEDASQAQTAFAQLEERARRARMHLMRLSARFEAEVAGLESADERSAFLASAGIAEPALERLTRLCMSALGLISFFTVGSDEVKQWLVRKGCTAPQAAGAIHSDLERGFIRAEVMKFSDLMELGGEAAVKRAGRYALCGREYVVEDGDIVNFLFNV